LTHCSSPASGNSTCQPAEPDGINGGTYTFALAVSDTAFSPAILKSENLATVTLTLTNTGTKPHGFQVECIPTPNNNGCPTTSCFPDASVLGPIAPDASATATFTAPNPEGIYTFGSNASSDTMTGQFVVQ
jgi:hypothetical protein